MQKSNLTRINESQPIGWLIYRPDTKEFVIGTQSDECLSVTLYTKEPCLAYLYKSERSAFHASTFIDHILEVVPAFDLGDELAVVFTDDM